MSRLVGSKLPAELLLRFCGDVAAPWTEQAILLATLDAEGRPHLAMISYFELAAADASQLYLAIGCGSRTEENLKVRRKASLALVDPSGTYYLKATAALEEGLVGFPHLAVFRLALEEVLVDEVRTDLEEAATLRSGITFSSPGESLSRRQSLRQALWARCSPFIS